jgi:hypothetical protein
MSGIVGMRSRRALALAAVMVSALCVGAAAAADTDEQSEDNRAPVRVIIGLDLSRSNPLIDSQNYASAMGDYVADYIKDLPLASVVMLRTFGTYDARDNNLRIDRSISSLRDEKPAAVGALMRQIVSNIPKMVHEGRLESQASTNIVAFLEDMSDVVDCRKMDARVLLISDGIEDSEYARLEHVNEHLPKPSYELFRGCSQMEIVGLGQGQRSPAVTEHLKDEWERWAKAAGFHSFVGLNNW